MKKFLIIFLACLLILGLCACGNKEENNGDETSTTASTTENTNDGNDDGNGDGDGDGDPVEPEPIVYETKTFILSADTSGTRWLGEREHTDRIYATCNYPGSGFESKIKGSGGTVSVKFMADGECSFLVYIDGELQKNSDGKELFAVKDDLIEIKNVPAGEHTLRLIRATEFGAYVEICTITFAGELLKADGIDDERMFIEFIGDGVESKVDSMAASGNVGASYSYLVADQMNVDYSITSYADRGLLATSKKFDYLYGQEFAGYFTRKADIVVVNLGTLDMQEGNIDAGEFKSTYRTFLKKVKQVNGEDCKIVLVWTSGNAEFENSIVSICKRLGGENAGYFAKVLQASSSIPPSASEHSAYAAELVEFINEIKNFEPKPITSGQNGNSDSVAFDSNEWENL